MHFENAFGAHKARRKNVRSLCADVRTNTNDRCATVQDAGAVLTRPHMPTDAHCRTSAWMRGSNPRMTPVF